MRGYWLAITLYSRHVAHSGKKKILAVTVSNAYGGYIGETASR